MALATVDQGDLGGDDGPPIDGDWLVTTARLAQSADCDWLVKLAQFDWQGGWISEGATSCVNWLYWRAQMARATAYEKLTVGHQLWRHPLLRDAYRQGRISYSATRLLARATDPDPEVEQALIEVAESSGMRALEQAIRYYELLSSDQPPEPATLRSFRIRNNGDGTKTLSVTVTEIEAEEMLAAMQMVIDRERNHHAKTTPGHSGTGTADPSPTTSATADTDAMAQPDNTDRPDTDWPWQPQTSAAAKQPRPPPRFAPE